MSLEFVRKTFEKLGRDDPLYAVLTNHDKRHNKWDPAEFFATGVAEIDGVVAYLDGLKLVPRREHALDFGCGVGRLSQALAAHFARVTGVDIADSMVARAREYNTHGTRVEYVVNTTEDLACFAGDTFDFVYSNITLQHIPPESAERYIAEFIRVLRPGGVALFQVPSGPEFAPGSLRALLYTVRRRYLRRAWKLIRGRAPYEMHYVPMERVQRIVGERGARMADIVDVGRGHRTGRMASCRYCVVKDPAPA